MKEAKAFVSELIGKKRMLLGMFFIYLISVYPIIRANFNYIDDMDRVMRGYSGWDNYSRYTSNFLSKLIHADSYLTDVSPLTQILAAVFIVLACGIVICRFLEERSCIWNAVPLLMIGLNPYFMECISYKYDSPYMALSILVSVVPLIFAESNLLLYGGISAVCMILMCTTYQGASGIYPMVSVLLCFELWNKKENRKALRLFLVSVLSYLAGLGFFKLFLMHNAENMYASGSMFGIKEIIPGVVTQLFCYYKHVVTDFKMVWLLLTAFLAIGFVIKEVVCSRQKKYYAILMSILCLCVLGVLMFGLYPALQSPIYNPRAMYGYGVFVALIGMEAASIKKEYLLKIGCICLTWCFFAFSFTYGNALGEQKRYTDFRVQMVINDLNDLSCMSTDQVKKVKIMGNIGRSPVFKNMPVDYAMLDRLVPDTFSDYGWGEYYFFEYFDIRNIERANDESMESGENEWIVQKNTMYHEILTDGENVLIVLK